MDLFCSIKVFPQHKWAVKMPKRSTALAINPHFHSFPKSAYFSLWLDRRGVFWWRETVMRDCGWLNRQRDWAYQLQPAESHMARGGISDSFPSFQCNQHLSSGGPTLIWRLCWAQEVMRWIQHACTVGFMTASIIHMTEHCNHEKREHSEGPGPSFQLQSLLALGGSWTTS